MTVPTKHYNPLVPRKVIQKIELVALALQETLHQDIALPDNWDDTAWQIGPIEGVARDGYIPFQRGGLEVFAFLTPDSNLSDGHGEALRDHNTDIQEQMDACDDDSAEQDALACEIDKLVTYVHFDIYVTTDDSVMVRYCLNYRDEPYFREKYDERVITTEYTIKDFLNFYSAREIVDDITLALSNSLPY